MITSSMKRKLTVLCYYWKILGLFPFQLTDLNLLKISVPGIVYATILCFAYLVSFQDIMINGFKTTGVYSSPMTIISDALGVCFNTLTVLSVWILPIIRVNKINDIIRKFRETSVSLNQAGINENVPILINKSIKICLVVNTGFFMHFMFNNFILVFWGADMYQGWIWNDLGLAVIQNTLVIFSNTLLVLKARFQKINHLVLNLPRISDSHLKSISKIHADLRDLLGLINNLFSLPVLLLLTTNFIEFAASGYLAYNKFIEDSNKKWELKNITTILALMSWVVYHSLQTFFVIVVSSSTVEEANKTGSTLHRIAPESTNTIEMVSVRLLQHPAKISLHGFIDLQFSLLFNIIKTITSLLVIMLQLDQHARESTEVSTMFPSPNGCNNYSTYSSNPNGPQ